jgi:glutathione S-transferase
MELIGQYDSPFVRRVGVTLHLYGFAFERQVLSVFGDFGAVLAVNPLGKVPMLRLGAGELLFDSQMIVDHLDELAGAARRAVLRRTAMALGMAEKVVALRSELYRRAEEKRDADWAKRLEIQVLSALNWLEGCSAEPWLSGSAPGQDDVAAAVAYRYLLERFPGRLPEGASPVLAELTAQAETLPAFRAAPFPAA